MVDQGAERCSTAAREARSSQRGDLREAAGHLLKCIQDVIPKLREACPDTTKGSKGTQVAELKDAATRR
jgi:hypothetical protein